MWLMGTCRILSSRGGICRPRVGLPVGAHYQGVEGCEFRARMLLVSIDLLLIVGGPRGFGFLEVFCGGSYWLYFLLLGFIHPLFCLSEYCLISFSPFQVVLPGRVIRLDPKDPSSRQFHWIAMYWGQGGSCENEAKFKHKQMSNATILYNL